MTTTREFDLADILSITIGRLLSHRHMDGVYDILGFMVSEDLFTHQLPRAADACAPALIEQHPWLAAIEPPAEDVPSSDLLEWLAAMETTHGKRHTVAPDPSRWERKDMLAELDQIAGTRPVVTVRTEDPT